MQEGNRVSPEVRIVGLVKDAKYQSLRETPQPTVYLALSQDTAAATRVNVEARATGEATSIEPAVIAALAEIEPRTTEAFTVFTTQIANSMKQETLLAMLSALFGGLALFLAMLGLYGVVSYNVARRRGEIGIRMALGAGRRRVAGMVMREVSLMVVIGLVVGTGLALGTTRLLSSFLYGLGATDVHVVLGAMAVLAGVAFVAAYLPAFRAARIDPMDALREE
jgi:putative ABC transport system permease protein